MSSYLSHDPRVKIAGVLDSAPIVRASKIHRQYSAIIGFHYRWFTGLDIALNNPFPIEAANLPSVCDDAGALLRMAGFRIRQAALSPDSVATVPVIIAGCSHVLHDFLRRDFFERGGILISSDRTILDVPLDPGTLECLDPSAARDVPLVVHDARQRANQVVPLPAGHIPVRLCDTGRERVRVIASEHGTGAPIVLACRIGNGWLLHSVTHWYQDAGSPELLAGAIRTMSLSLLAGLEYVLTTQEK